MRLFLQEGTLGERMLFVSVTRVGSNSNFVPGVLKK